MENALSNYASNAFNTIKKSTIQGVEHSFNPMASQGQTNVVPSLVGNLNANFLNPKKGAIQGFKTGLNQVANQTFSDARNLLNQGLSQAQTKFTSPSNQMINKAAAGKEKNTKNKTHWTTEAKQLQKKYKLTWEDAVKLRKIKHNLGNTKFKQMMMETQNKKKHIKGGGFWDILSSIGRKWMEIADV